MSVAAAGGTLARAARFWAEQGGRPDATWHEPDAAVQARYTANCLRELDGFLRVLLDELAPTPVPWRQARQRNTANKLSAMALDGHATGGVASADCARLRAIGRSAACLFHLGGWVRRPDVASGGWMTAGWPDLASASAPDTGPDTEGVLRRYPLGDRLRPRGEDVASVCGFYLRLGEAVRG